MSLSPEQKQIVATWVAAGDSLAVVQKKISEEFKVSMTYMDVRFLVDDLGLELKNAAHPQVDAETDLGKARPAPPAPADKKGGLLDKLKKAVGAGSEDEAEAGTTDEDEPGLAPASPDGLDASPPAGKGSVKVALDRVMRPGMVVSGSVTFSDGTSGKWAMDQYGRLLLETGKKGYQPSAADVQIFQRELSRQLQRQGY
ncbi:MAG: hypothetical protein PHE83_10060 [Opitutaceae bacterium]|nr:hypothetical protein [Opitutaceae bacterium]